MSEKTPPYKSKTKVLPLTAKLSVRRKGSTAAPGAIVRPPLAIAAPGAIARPPLATAAPGAIARPPLATAAPGAIARPPLATAAPPFVGNLDTLAQLRKAPPESPALASLDTLKKRARSKYVSDPIAISLAELRSPLEKSYRNTWYCTRVIRQEGQTLVSRYCNARWCITCNRIRTGKLMNGYEAPLADLADKHFVTLTIPNVPAGELAGTIGEMLANFKKIQDVMRKRKKPLTGLRKLECTYNEKRNDFHPHFHAIISSEEEAAALQAEWLVRYPAASELAQDVRTASDGDCKELFKYFTKLVSRGAKRRINPAALDTMFQAMRGFRVFQNFGKLKKVTVSEDVEKVQAKIYTDLDERRDVYEWTAPDWFSVTDGSELTGYKPSEAIECFVAIIDRPPSPTPPKPLKTANFAILEDSGTLADKNLDSEPLELFLDDKQTLPYPLPLTPSPTPSHPSPYPPPPLPNW